MASKSVFYSFLKKVFSRLFSAAFWRAVLSRLFLVWRWGRLPLILAVLVVLTENRSALVSGSLLKLIVSLGANLGGSVRSIVSSLSALNNVSGMVFWFELWDVVTAYLHIAVYFRLLFLAAWILENQNYSPALLYIFGGTIFGLLVLIDSLLNGKPLPVSGWGSAWNGFLELLNGFSNFLPVDGSGSVNGSVNSTG